jgi:uncharacterized membrane protein
MERLLAVVFNDEGKAYEGLRAINQLDAEGSITAYAAQVIKKEPDGRISAKQTDGNFPLQTAKGLVLGSLIGLLGGPVGVGVGALVGASAGTIGDLNIADVNLDFVQEVADALTPGLHALIVDANEEWVTPVDTRMEALGGVVFRTGRQHFEAEQRAKEVTALKTEIADLKAEHAEAKADRKAKLQTKIDNLNTKLQQKLQKAKQRSEQIKNETDAKVQALKGQAAKVRGDAKANIEASIARMREQFDQSTAKLKKLAA